MQVYAVCSKCAHKAGGVWPPNHLATFHAGACDACGQQSGLCSVDDYNWPRGKPKDWIGTGRD